MLTPFYRWWPGNGDSKPRNLTGRPSDLHEKAVEIFAEIARRASTRVLLYSECGNDFLHKACALPADAPEFLKRVRVATCDRLSDLCPGMATVSGTGW